ncbi:hypothetical protein G9F71_008940 [Clostridium sp. FP2]|uniref:hypothetical protein n=1 Tax=Clostridium sp. FP2 TaxID=2724481 RepID=UPI0013E93618|nr:hypothetical protein [Clostridium sp. FP2]MBZ9622980.1 hypothetical protein [Clostridium sp. FP2]
MDKKTENILTRDSVAESEKGFGGKHWSQFNNAENLISLFNSRKDNEIKEEHLKVIRDTFFGMSWDYFKSLIKEKGFVNGYSYELNYNSYGKTTKEEIMIYYHPSKGLVVYAESYNNKTTVNSGTLYGEIQSNDKEGEKTIWKWLSTGGCINQNKLIYETSHDIREGLFSKLDTLESAGKFLNKWTNKNRFLWFVDYVENKVESYDYKQITRDKIKKCPKELQQIIGI